MTEPRTTQHGVACGGCRELGYLERAEKAEATLARVEDWGREQAKPFVDGVPDREGEAVWAGLQAAIAGEQS